MVDDLIRIMIYFIEIIIDVYEYYIIEFEFKCAILGNRL